MTTTEVEYDFSGFIPTNKQKNKKNNSRRSPRVCPRQVGKSPRHTQTKGKTRPSKDLRTAQIGTIIHGYTATTRGWQATKEDTKMRQESRESQTQKLSLFRKDHVLTSKIGKEKS